MKRLNLLTSFLCLAEALNLRASSLFWSWKFQRTSSFCCEPLLAEWYSVDSTIVSSQVCTNKFLTFSNHYMHEHTTHSIPIPFETKTEGRSAPIYHRLIRLDMKRQNASEPEHNTIFCACMHVSCFWLYLTSQDSCSGNAPVEKLDRFSLRFPGGLQYPHVLEL